jgi:hypothetical protein
MIMILSGRMKRIMQRKMMKRRRKRIKSGWMWTMQKTTMMTVVTASLQSTWMRTMTPMTPIHLNRPTMSQNLLYVASVYIICMSC